MAVGGSAVFPLTGVAVVTWTLRICGLVFSATMFVSASDGWQTNQAFSARGQQALVEPMQEYTETTKIKKKFSIEVDESISHSAELAFTTASGQRISVKKNLPDDILARFLEGEDVYVEYLPEDPKRARFAGETSSPIGLALLGLAVLTGTALFWKKF